MALRSRSATATRSAARLQFFDEAGEAVHKVHLRPASNLYAYQKLVADARLADQSPDGRR